MSLSLLLENAAYISFMNVFIQLPLRCLKMQDQKSLTHCSLSCSRWGRECFSLVVDYKGGRYITQRQPYTNVNVLRLAIDYLNATIDRNTRKPEPQIGTNGSSQNGAGLDFEQVSNQTEPCWRSEPIPNTTNRYNIVIASIV